MNVRTSRGAAALPLLLLLAACATPAPQTAPAPAGATAPAISPEDFRLRAGILAHDTMRGREVGTPGIRAAARYLVEEATRLGLRPAGDQGGYYNRVPLQRRIREMEVTVASGGASTPVALTEVVPASGLVGLPPTTRMEGSGPLVFAGHLADPEIGDRELGARDLAGAVVIVRLAPPPGVDAQTTPPRMPVAMLFSPASPAAAVLLVAEEDDAEIWSHISSIARRGSVEVPSEAAPAGAGPAFFMVSPAFVERLLGSSLESAREPRTGLGTFTYSLRERVEAIEAWNVVAVLPGSDPRRAGQFVSLGAHYDHVGVGSPVAGDSIYNGADDNASGTAALLEVAERFASLPAARRPARSLLFVWHTAEEHGLLGSAAFTEAATVPRDSIVVNVNADMLARNGTDSLFVVGAGRLSSQLAGIVEAANRGLDRPFTLDYSLDSPGHPERIYCRSDHYNFARFGIPVVFLTSGLHADYHQPSDSVEKLDAEKGARAARFMAEIARTVADSPTPLVIDRPRSAARGECEG